MKKHYVKYIILTFVIIVTFLISGFWLSDRVVKSLLQPKLDMEPFVSIAKIIDSFDSENKIKAIYKYFLIQGKDRNVHLELVNERGEVIFPIEYRKKYSPTQFKKIDKNYEYIVFEEEFRPPFPIGKRGEEGPRFGHDKEIDKIERNAKNFPRPKRDREMPFPPPPPGFAGPGGPMGMFFGPPKASVGAIKLAGEPRTYLVVRMNPLAPEGRKSHMWLAFVGLGSLLLSILLGVVAAIFVIYNMVSKKVDLADQVISRIQRGDLKARFEIKRQDEFGKAMGRFNIMADEIEKLVNRLKEAESNRIRLLQELAHDLRTPIASMKGVLETLASRSQELDSNQKNELLELASKESDYFANLVEDLLLLAQVSDPKFVNTNDILDFATLANDELDECEFRIRQWQQNIQVHRQISVENLKLHGNASLMKRLVRNLLENSVHYARSQVKFEAKLDGGHLLFDIIDDGPGFSDEILLSYGERKFSRELRRESHGKVSIGLGSVVIKRIVELHGGTLLVKNDQGLDGRITGAHVTIILPQIETNRTK